ncbi:S9 family peptidase [Flavobacteriaceae bacterium]|nr:S9 family peptidase [Flavobacteriaceae bacterium]
MISNNYFFAAIFLIFSSTLLAQEKFEMEDIFALQYATDVQISPDGKQIVYRKMGYDIMSDKNVGDLWIMNTDGSNHQKLTLRDTNEYSPRWSPDGDRIAFISQGKNGSEIFMYWTQSSKMARMTQLAKSPSSLTWSRDGKQLAFSMFVPSPPPVIAKIPKSPKGAQWAKKPRITDRLNHESDGSGYIPTGFSHIFVMSSNGGLVKQVTSGDFHHRGTISWSKDNKSLYFSANRNANWEYDFRNSEVYKISLNNGQILSLTQRDGPDYAPSVSPDGKMIAFIGFDDKREAYQNRMLYLMDTNGTNKRLISQDIDASISAIQWDPESKGLYFNYDHQGNGKIGYLSISGKEKKIADNRGGTTLGRPYGSGMFSVSQNGKIAYTYSRPNHPADIALVDKKGQNWTRLTQLNQALFSFKKPGKVEEIWYASSVDGKKLQGWVVYPPHYDSSKEYPFMVENHGGPILNYGDRFSIEMQLYASAGYIVFYPNPRGSTSYGEDFANLLLNNYPGEDYNDVMDGVDACIAKGIAHEDQLFVTGGSAGGIMSAWMIGKNNRFEAAVVVKPVMNWISKLLVADNYYGYANSRYPGQVWENPTNYWKFSPISLVGNVETPTMVMVGMDDLRTPPSEAKQLYHALKLRKIPTVLVEIPEASHGIAKRPSNLMTKIAHTLAWFNKYKN